MKTYRRIEVNAYRRRVTIVSGEWPREISSALPPETDERVSLNDVDSCERLEPDSPEGQLILAEAVRSLERRLSPETRAMICPGQDALIPNDPNRNYFYLRLRSIYDFIPKVLRSTRRAKWNDAAKQSVKD